MSTNKKFTVIIVNYNSLNKLKNLIKSLSLINKRIKKIIIIDNNSEFFNISPTNKIICIKNKTNNGFAKAVNQGIKLADTEIILLLNPDSKLIDRSPIETFKIISNNKNIGAIGGKIIQEKSNHIQYTATNKPNFLTGIFEFTNIKKLFPNNRYSNNFWIEKNKKIKKPIQVHSLCGAYIFLRREKNLIFNEKLFLYLEDLYLGKTLEKNKYEVWFDPNSHIRHLGGGSNKSKYNIVLNH